MVVSGLMTSVWCALWRLKLKGRDPESGGQVGQGKSTRPWQAKVGEGRLIGLGGTPHFLAGQGVSSWGMLELALKIKNDSVHATDCPSDVICR